MAKLFDYPRRGWEADSDCDADQLALAFCKIASDVGMEVHRLSASNPAVIGWDSVVKFPGGHIQFKNERAGCHIVVINSYEDKEIDYGILFLWKHFVDKGIIFGGPYRRDLNTSNGKNFEEKTSRTIKPEDLYPKDVDEKLLKDIRELSKIRPRIRIPAIAQKLIVSESQVKRYRRIIKAREEVERKDDQT